MNAEKYTYYQSLHCIVNPSEKQTVFLSEGDGKTSFLHKNSWNWFYKLPLNWSLKISKIKCDDNIYFVFTTSTVTQISSLG